MRQERLSNWTPIKSNLWCLQIPRNKRMTWHDTFAFGSISSLLPCRIGKCLRLLSETEPFTRTIALINVNGVVQLLIYWEIVVYQEILFIFKVSFIIVPINITKYSFKPIFPIFPIPTQLVWFIFVNRHANSCAEFHHSGICGGFSFDLVKRI